MSWNAPQNWSEALNSVSRMFSFSCRPLRLKGQPQWVLSDPARELCGHRDKFTEELLAQCATRKERYLTFDYPEARSVKANDVIYIVSRDGNALVAKLGNGDVIVNEAAMTGLPRYRDAIARVVPVLEGISVETLGHFTSQ